MIKCEEFSFDPSKFTEEQLRTYHENKSWLLISEYNGRAIIFGEEAADIWFKEQIKDG